MKLTFKILWYDLWVGFFYDRESVRIYFCPLPCFVFCLDLMGQVLSDAMAKKYTIKEFETAVQNVFSIATFFYYLILMSVIMWWGR
jgi:hypothetical protein